LAVHRHKILEFSKHHRGKNRYCLQLGSVLH
jgi:hypothetical protein